MTAKRLSMRESADLVRKVAIAVQYAHERGVIHRDLKPSNIMVDAAGEPHVIDFGLAKREAGEITMTVEGQILGTPAYMSPEQASGQAHRADAKTDVYSLGVILFELLTGELPFRGDMQMLLVQIKNDEPPRPRTLNANIPRDLETIVLKCLEKQATKRYESAIELGSDLQAWLENKPISARPVNQFGRALRLIKRHPVPTALTAALLMALVLGTTVSISLALTASRNAAQAQANAEKERIAHANELKERMLADEQRQKAKLLAEAEFKAQAKAQVEQQKSEKLLYISQIGRANEYWNRSNAVLAMDILASCRPESRGWEYDYLNATFKQNQMTLRGHAKTVHKVTFSPNGKYLASESCDGTIKLWNSVSGTDFRTLKGNTTCVTSVVFSPDGKLLASGGGGNTIKLWDFATGKELLSFKGHSESILSLAFSPDGKQIASASQDQSIKLWDIDRGREALTLQGHMSAVLSVSFSPDGKRIASGSADQTIKIWDASNGQEQLLLRGHTNKVSSVSYSYDGSQLASGSWDNTIKLWDASSGEELLSLKGHTREISCVAFSPDGKHVASGSDDQTIKIWNAKNGQELTSLKGHTSFVLSIAYSPDGKRIASGSYDQSVKLWDVESGQESFSLNGHAKQVLGICFSPNSKLLASANEDHTVKLWDLASGQEMATLKRHTQEVACIAFSPNGQYIVSGSRDETAKVWDANTFRELHTLRGHRNKVASVVFSPDSKRIATGGLERSIKLWEVESGKELMSLNGHDGYVVALAFHPDGKTIASGGYDQKIRVWNTDTGNEISVLNGHEGSILSIAFSPNGKRLVSGSTDKTIKVWSTDTGDEPTTLKGHMGSVLSVTFSPDGKRIASGGSDNAINLWEAEGGEEMLSLDGHSDWVTCVSFSPDARKLASASRDNSIRVWDAGDTPVEELARELTVKRILRQSASYETAVLTLQEIASDDPEFLRKATERLTALHPPDSSLWKWKVFLAFRENLLNEEKPIPSLTNLSMLDDDQMYIAISVDDRVKLLERLLRQNRFLDAIRLSRFGDDDFYGSPTTECLLACLNLAGSNPSHFLRLREPILIALKDDTRRVVRTVADLTCLLAPVDGAMGERILNELQLIDDRDAVGKAQRLVIRALTLHRMGKAKEAYPLLRSCKILTAAAIGAMGRQKWPGVLANGFLDLFLAEASQVLEKSDESAKHFAGAKKAMTDFDALPNEDKVEEGITPMPGLSYIARALLEREIKLFEAGKWNQPIEATEAVK